MNDRALKWITGCDTGLSSKALWAVMMGQKGKDHPHDPSDLGRCLRLLVLVPEWKPRIREMAAVSPYWSALVSRWEDLEATMADECGPAFDRLGPAPKSWKLMRQLLDTIEKADRNVVRLGDGVTIGFGS